MALNLLDVLKIADCITIDDNFYRTFYLNENSSAAEDDFLCYSDQLNDPIFSEKELLSAVKDETHDRWKLTKPETGEIFYIEVFRLVKI